MNGHDGQGGRAEGDVRGPGDAPVRLAVTMGDPAGIGPEIVARAFLAGELDDAVVVGDMQVMRRELTSLLEAAAAGGAAPRWPIVAQLARADASVPPGALPVWQPADNWPAGLAALPSGRIDARCGAAAARAVEAAAALVRQGLADAIVTAPLHKEALAAAGVPYPGHTEMLQALATIAGAAPPPVRMMLANGELCVVLATIHLSLRAAIETLDFDAVRDTIAIADRHAPAGRDGRARPRIAVAGLNPHAGEGGLFGDEEQRFIGPAVRAARDAGVDVHGPFAPDTVFMRARRGEFDVVVAMVHDHGLIPVKYLGVEHGVNVTLGLPFVRTSPDHGTAFDIAGLGRADASSLIAALRWARRLARAGAGPGRSPQGTG